MNFETFLNNIAEWATHAGLKLLAAVVVLIIGRLLIKWVMKLVGKGKMNKKLDHTVAQFLTNALRIALYVILVIIIIGILGVPMASIITVLASAGVAIGLALQGALTNLAGGIMILIFHPFRLDDFIEAGSFSGTVKDIGFFYTVLCTGDNRMVTVPNGTIMGEEIVNYQIRDMANAGVNLFPSIVNYWTHTGETDYYGLCESTFSDLLADSSQEIIKGLAAAALSPMVCPWCPIHSWKTGILWRLPFPQRKQPDQRSFQRNLNAKERLCKNLFRVNNRRAFRTTIARKAYRLFFGFWFCSLSLFFLLFS